MGFEDVRSARLGVILVLALAAIVAWPADGLAQRADTALEHFQCYPVLSFDTAAPAPPIIVELSDQFEQEVTVRVGLARRFCVPTTKIHANKVFDVTDADQHLMLYATSPETGPRRIVSIRNQFGRQKLLTREPVAIAVPTRKLFPGQHEFPGGLDHYRCYAATGRDIQQKVALNDQFSSALQGHLVIDPVAFCNPVQKTDTAGNVWPIRDRDAHLACYGMTRVPFQGLTYVENQFESEPPGQYRLFAADTLCVPTAKLGFEEIPDRVPGAVPDKTAPRD